MLLESSSLWYFVMVAPANKSVSIQLCPMGEQKLPTENYAFTTLYLY